MLISIFLVVINLALCAMNIGLYNGTDMISIYGALFNMFAAGACFMSAIVSD